VIAILNGIVIIPFYLKFIDNTLYGAWLATGNILVWITILDPGIGDLVQQKLAFYFAQDKIKDIEKTITIGIILSLIIGIIILFSSYFLADFIPRLLKLDNKINSELLIQAFKITAIGTALTVMTFGLVGINQGFQGTFMAGIIYTLGQLIALSLNLFLLFRGYGLMSIAYGRLAWSAVFFGGHLCFLFYHILALKLKPSFDKPFFLSFTKIFTYTFVAKISSTLSSNIDLVIVSRYISPMVVANLELTRRPIRTISSFIDRLSVAFLPSLSHLFGEGDINKFRMIYIRFIAIFLWVTCFIAIGFIIFNESFVTIWVGKKFFIGQSQNILLVIGFIITSMTYALSNFIFSTGKIKELSMINTVKSIVYLVLLYPLTKYWGIYGIIIAPILAALLVELWFYLKLLKETIENKFSDYRFLIKDLLIILTVSISSFICFDIFFKITTVFEFIYLTVLFSIIYWITLAIFSIKFRNEMLIAFSSFKNKIRNQKQKVYDPFNENRIP
jgi:O-antigen/teichoic acid export membrane protein